MRTSVVLESSLWCSKCVTCMDFIKNASFASFDVIKNFTDSKLLGLATA